MNAASQLLQNYLSALANKNIDAIARISDSHSLVEIPFLKPNRLSGNAEIIRAHGEIFTNLESIELSLSNVEAGGNHAIGAGQLRFTRADGNSESLAAGIVAEAGAEKLTRISLYCDARNLRPWSDKTIMGGNE